LNYTSKALFTRYYIFCLLTALVLFGGVTGILFSCESEDVAGNGEIYLTKGDPITVNFTVDGFSFDNNEITLHNASPNPSVVAGSARPSGIGESKTVVTPIAEDLYMYATLQEDVATVSLRAALLTADTKVRIVVYSGASYTDHADYKIMANGDLQPLEASLILPSGSYRFVACSYNDTITIPPTFTNTTDPIASRDVLWGDTTVTIGAANATVHINLHHLFAQVRLQAELNPLAGNVINAISGARVWHTFPELSINTGVLSPIIPTMTDTVHFTWLPSTNPAIRQSNYLPVYINGTGPVVEIDNIEIDNSLYTNGPNPYILDYQSSLVPGHEYTLLVSFLPSTLSVSSNSLTFAQGVSGSGYEQSVTVTTNLPNWSFSVAGANASDFVVSASGNTLRVYPASNPCYSPRTATITVTAGSRTRTVTVTQNPGVWRLDYTGGAQTFTTLCGGTYQIEVWGARGSGFNGGYAKGNVNLNGGQVLNIFVGGMGSGGTGTGNIIPGGYNGGGNAWGYNDGNNGSGGGATDIRVGGTALVDRIMVAGGGGGYVGANGFPDLGVGGGLTGGTGSVLFTIVYSAGGGTQTSGGSSAAGGVSVGSFGQGGNGGTRSQQLGHTTGTTLSHRSGGGGGYYGGGQNMLAGGGGSGFISGHSGCNAVNASGVHQGHPNHFSGLIFNGTVLIAGDASMPNPNGGTMTGNGGHGVAIITYLGP